MPIRIPVETTGINRFIKGTLSVQGKSFLNTEDKERILDELHEKRLKDNIVNLLISDVQNGFLSGFRL